MSPSSIRTPSSKTATRIIRLNSSEETWGKIRLPISVPAIDALDKLRVLVPSFNVSTIPIDDAATLVRPANLRSTALDSEIGAARADAIGANPTVKSFGAEEREEARFAQTADGAAEAKPTPN